MKTRPINQKEDSLSQQKFSEQLNPKHELIVLAKHIDWEAIEQHISPYCKE